MQATHYQVLGVDAGASLEDIHAAYRAALQQLRQKLAGDAAPGPEFIDALRAAYKTLTDAAARAAYDQSLSPFPTAGAATVVTAPARAAAVEATTAFPLAGETAAERHPFRFAGNGGEYFRIWIVNLLLSILTLGIYSAWAKVRREQYFHRNLLLDGSGFDYHAKPTAILKGRALAFGLLVILSITEKLGPMVHALAVLALLPLVPWLVVRAFRFRAHNTSYRGLRFSFHGSYRQALNVFIGYGILTGFTVGLCFPLWYRQQRQFMLDNLRFGTAPFSCRIGIWPVYRIFLMPVLAAVLAFAAIGAVAAGVSALPKGQAQAAAGGIFAVVIVVFLLAQLLVIPYIRVRSANLVWNGTRVGPQRTESSMRLFAYLRLVVVNWLLLVLTLGLFWPWAKVRMAAYRADNLALLATTPLDAFVAGEATSAAAAGDEIAEMFDFDVGV